jgi:hypothetical protein
MHVLTAGFGAGVQAAGIRGVGGARCTVRAKAGDIVCKTAIVGLVYGRVDAIGCQCTWRKGAVCEIGADHVERVRGVGSAQLRRGCDGLFADRKGGLLRLDAIQNAVDLLTHESAQSGRAAAPVRPQTCTEFWTMALHKNEAVYLA